MRYKETWECSEICAIYRSDTILLQYHVRYPSDTISLQCQVTHILSLTRLCQNVKIIVLC